MPKIDPKEVASGSKPTEVTLEGASEQNSTNSPPAALETREQVTDDVRTSENTLIMWASLTPKTTEVATDSVITAERILGRSEVLDLMKRLVELEEVKDVEIEREVYDGNQALAILDLKVKTERGEEIELEYMVQGDHGKGIEGRPRFSKVTSISKIKYDIDGGFDRADDFEIRSSGLEQTTDGRVALGVRVVDDNGETVLEVDLPVEITIKEDPNK